VSDLTLLLLGKCTQHLNAIVTSNLYCIWCGSEGSSSSVIDVVRYILFPAYFR
jgi:hypothetical protein